MDRRELLKAAGLMLGAAVSPSCRQALESSVDLSAAPVSGSLSEHQRVMIGMLAELIIPETDTPGATAAGVPSFIHQIVVDWYTPAERTLFLEGLADLDAAAQRHWSRSFRELSAIQQGRLLTELEPPSEGAGDVQFLAGAYLPAGASGDAPFHVKLKELTVLGYYSSELAAHSELVYLPIPGFYDGDFLFSEIGRQWTL